MDSAPPLIGPMLHLSLSARARAYSVLLSYCKAQKNLTWSQQEGSAQQVKTLAAKRDDVSSDPRSHVVERTKPERFPLTLAVAFEWPFHTQNKRVWVRACSRAHAVWALPS